jgi:predicted transglutaminase-like cysteine proteinase
MKFRPALALLAAVSAFSATPASSQSLISRNSSAASYSWARSAPAVRVITPASPDVFGTAAVDSGVTLYDARFRRVANADRDDPVVTALAAKLRGLSPEAQLEAVQRLVLERVRWVSDLDTVKVSDLWSNAAETLARGAGDSEDIAIVQMQVLKAAGFDPKNLYISIGKRKNVGAHVVLLARTLSGFYMLDDKLGRPLAARDSGLFTPVFTIGQGKSFIHGRRVAAASPSAKSR